MTVAMMKTSINGLLLGVVVGMSGLYTEQANAQAYLSVFSGGNFLSPADNTGPTTGLNAKSFFSSSYIYGGSAGYSFMPSWRVEGEVAYRRGDLSDFSIVNDGGLSARLGVSPLNGLTLPARGHIGTLSLMGNVFYDFDLGSPFTPYAGGGIGLAKHSANKVSISGTTIVNDDSVDFAYQFAAGTRYAISPQAALFLEYRYFGTAAPKFLDITGATINSEYRTHSVLVGLRFGL
jgi:outer membrane autotransporter protein